MTSAPKSRPATGETTMNSAVFSTLSAGGRRVEAGGEPPRVEVPARCGCRELGHVMRPADTRVSGRRGGLVVAAERSLQAAGEWALQAPAVAAIGADGGCCSARRTHAAPPRGGAVR